ncbi:MAG TPA: RNA methyltransferase [Stackebrandtia sp.]|jgi:TrmH family RNA methyltransferase|uniref:TrmH family RNA methyltransferase n=1 Tax=Stackebrandtia sp. TaxID=2023065 RepID=UPI002D2A8670|nr:RNA methyltransferase [Stackebrandtia sp.]HZE39646.1 RNA methyltransferase [Stackebrandtia sp.]
MPASPSGTTPLTRTSSRIAAARKLTRRKYRDARRRFLAEGPNAVSAALGRGGVVRELFAAADALERHTPLAAAAEQQGARLNVVTADALASLSETVTPQGIIAECEFVDAALATDSRLVAVLDGVSDPGNAGTILRTADAAGAGAVVFPHGAVDPYNGKCVRSSAGSLFQVPVTRGGDTADHLRRLRDAGLSVLVADAHGDVDLDDADDLLRRPTAWIFGSEAHGLPEAIAAQANARVRVPIYGAAESLNLATAAAVCLYASARQQRLRRTEMSCAMAQMFMRPAGGGLRR